MASDNLEEKLKLQRVFKKLVVDLPMEQLVKQREALEQKRSLTTGGQDSGNTSSNGTHSWDQKYQQCCKEIAELQALGEDSQLIQNQRIHSTTLQAVFAHYGFPLSQKQVADIIWEVNDRLDGFISWKEYKLCYERCLQDNTGLEPTDFFYLICFLMYDKGYVGQISTDDAMHMLYIKNGAHFMSKEIEVLFDDKMKKEEPPFLTYTEFYEALNQRRESMIDNSFQKGKHSG